MTELDVIDFLQYRAYAFNRKNSPEIAPEKWSLIWPNASEMEKKYQEEISHV